MKIVDESILFFSRVSLLKFSLETLVFRGYKGLYIVGWERNAKSKFFPNRVVWRLGLVIGLSHEFKLRANNLANLGLLFCSAIASMTLQLSHVCQLWRLASRESAASPSRESLHLCTILSISSHFLTHYPYMIPT